MKQLTNKQARLIFRERFGDFSDSMWYRNKHVFSDDFPLTEENVIWLADIKKMLPRLNLQQVDIVTAVKKTKEALSRGHETTTGAQFLELLSKQEIVPHRNTITNWFRNLGGFNKHKTYKLEDLSSIILAAYSFKIKQTIINTIQTEIVSNG